MKNKKEKIENLINDGKKLLGRRLNFENSEFISWNNAVIRFLEKNYGVDSTTTNNFKARDYYPITYYECSGDDFVKKFEIDLNTSLEDLRRLAEELDDEDIYIKDNKNNICSNAKEKVIFLIEKFHTVAKQLKHRQKSKESFEINDEYDVQDLFHTLLHIYFNDIRAEEFCPSYAGKNTRTDFLLKDEKIFIEIKKTRDGLTDKELGDQLINDIAHYKMHSDCKTLICFVYDPEERIKNPIGIEKDISSEKEIDVHVKIVQK